MQISVSQGTFKKSLNNLKKPNYVQQSPTTSLGYPSIDVEGSGIYNPGSPFLNLDQQGSPSSSVISWSRFGQISDPVILCLQI